MTISKPGLDLIKSFEGFSSKPYHCSAGVSTIGYGSTYYEGGRHVKMSDAHVSKERATQILENQVNNVYSSAVNRYVKVPLTQNQFDALVSFTYNLGAGALKSSTLLRKLNLGKYTRASQEFLKWDRAGGKRLKGLTRRRRAESKLFLS